MAIPSTTHDFLSPCRISAVVAELRQKENERFLIDVPAVRRILSPVGFFIKQKPSEWRVLKYLEG